MPPHQKYPQAKQFPQAPWAPVTPLPWTRIALVDHHLLSLIHISVTLAQYLAQADQFRGNSGLRHSIVHRSLSPSPCHTQANLRYRRSGPSVSNTRSLASLSVPAALTQEPMRQSPHGACPQLAYRQNIQKSAAKTSRNTIPNLRPSADRVSKVIDLNTRLLVRLVSPQADGLIDRLLIEHDTAPVRRRNVSEVSAINEYAWKLMLETALKELKVPICRLSTIGRALKDFYNESEISDEAKRSDPLLRNIKDLLDRIEQTLPLFADINHIELALAGLRLKRLGLGNADH